MKKTFDFYKNITTQVNIIKPKFKLIPGESFFVAGSCFAENLHKAFCDCFIPSSLLPTGNTYNPVSLEESFKMVKTQRLNPNGLIRSKDFFYHFGFMHSLCDKNKDHLRNILQQKLQKSLIKLQNSSCLILTLGTAFVYIKKSNNMVVNNCHKLPGNEFLRKKLSLSEIIESLSNTINLVKTINPDIKIILTLSPVRHLRDSASENSLSKALLRCAIDEVTKTDSMWYFPSYEILLDELRDYRWYSSDMAHPSTMAIDYIIHRFFEETASKNLVDFLEKASKISLLLGHRPYNPESKEALDLKEKIKEKISLLKIQYPFITIPEDLKEAE